MHRHNSLRGFGHGLRLAFGLNASQVAAYLILYSNSVVVLVYLSSERRIGLGPVVGRFYEAS